VTSNLTPLAHSAVPLREPVYARYRSQWNYWLMTDKRVNGRRFTIEQFGKVREWAEPIVHGTDYIVDGLYVTSAEFDRLMRLEGIP
jgi:hypothetical protein